jgi:hypothetical protein
MPQEPLVDLLLVRLGREEEKKRVRTLLVNGLGMSDTEAEEAVENSPSVLREAIPMVEARDIQKRLYPFIDLLPRIDETTEPPPPKPEGPEEEARAEEEVEEDFTSGIDEESLEFDFLTSGTPHSDPVKGNAPAPSEEETGDDIILTSARQEMLQIDRCHVCGRTPTDGEKLAPCRTCGALTCRDCFDRTAHVCEKCATEGKVVSGALAGTPEYISKHDHHLDSDTPKTAQDEKKAPKSGLLMKILIPVCILLALGAVFYFMDPMNFFAGDEQGNNGTLPVDTTVVDSTSVDTLALTPDTSFVEYPDSLQILPDTILVIESVNPLGLTSLTLPDSLVLPGEIPSIEVVGRFSSGEIETMNDELTVITTPIEQYAALCNLTINRLTLVRIDEYVVLLMSVLHPEDNTNRYKFLNYIAGFLYSSDVDQFVFYYRENRFQNTSILTYTSDSFDDLQTATSPQDFQQFAGSHGGSVWESVSGELQDTLTETVQ